MNKRALFVSDLHFGSNYSYAFPNRERHFCDFLREIPKDTSHLFILGDLFEFWMEYQHYIPKNHFEILHQLKSLTDSGVEVHYLGGNHDFNLGTFFSRHLGMQVHSGFYPYELQGKKLILLHGDGLSNSDWKYRQVKRILLSPLANRLFKLIHPDWGMNLAKLVGKTSRMVPREANSGEYFEGIRHFFDSADVVIHGHTHKVFIQNHEFGMYINTGEWLKKMYYVEMRDGSFKIEEYQP